ncbi:DUF4136 domain-containing protein [Parasphingopyxis algicola]|uniref:DUF4136 domain-containing protein n=1 Tax=Parasphingopyxis algicola TaxID=2026624 RepID=UPI0015A233E6|nr:DUF4136 domain-containing protein [Parasphingopyxis algicola]QLC24429.1 DUF4136 domain-containing protein [Parasphingopyxis algicola]
MSRKILALAAPLALLAVAACTTPFRADVARFQQMPAPQGQSFYIQPAEEGKADSLEFATYANLVSAELGDYGYTPANSPQDATLVVTMDYGVDDGRERIVTTPGSYRGYWGHRSLFYSPYYSRLRWRSPYYYGWYDPFFDSGFGYPRVRSYTLYTSELDLRIARIADGEPVFEGRARARSRNDALTELVPNLVEAMFTNFPGNSGEEVRITVLPPEDR